MSSREPLPAGFDGVIGRYVAATRPAFLSVTIVGALLGTGYALWRGATLRLPEALIAIVFVLAAHAGTNVLNDYFDALNGSDDANVERLFPYTGGSRMIQNCVMTRHETFVFGVLLLATVVPAGLWLVARSGVGLLPIGLAGLVIGWTYSAPPLALMARGLGETAVAAGFLLIVLGAGYVQSGAIDAGACIAGLPYALLVANLLFVNEFPDHRADAMAGKRTLVVRLGPAAARWGYAAVCLVAHVWLIGAVLAGLLPAVALLGLASVIPCARAAREVIRHAEAPAHLVVAIRATIAAAMIHGALVAASLFAVTLRSAR